jgi:hypothetical protein
MDAFNLPFRPGAGTAKEKKTGSHFFKRGDGKDSSKMVTSTEGEITGGKRKRSSAGDGAAAGDGAVIDVDLEDDDIEMLPTPKKKADQASPEWEASDTEQSPAVSAEAAEASPEWEMSDHDGPDQDTGGALEANGMLSAPWKDPLDSDSE